MAVVVLGSINIDLVVQVSHLPHQGETVIGNRFFTACGGKGANCAVAIAKLGINVSMVGAVGKDDFGQTLIKGLQQAGVNTQGVMINSNIHSGVASIVVDEAGNNTIACAGGANSFLGDAQIQQLLALLPRTKVVLLELGIPIDVVIAAADAAKSHDCTLILDPAPARADLPAHLYPMIDILTPNEVEASQLVGFTVTDVETAKNAGLVLLDRGVKTVIVTLGSQGAVCCTTNETFFVPPLAVSVVDTVAAGDAFNGGLVAALVLGKSLKEALQWATVAGALSVTKPGAQSSLPDKESFWQFLSL